MDSSLTLLTAQVHFLDTNLALIHIPLRLYAYFVQPVLQLIVPAESSCDEAFKSPHTGADSARPRRPWAYEHPFVNISITPVECSVACSVSLAKRLFAPIRERLGPALKEEISISEEEYVVIQVDGEGLDAGQRVLELSSPLAMNGISIFFYSTYFSDYILVPLRSRSSVINALEEKGFAFSQESEGFVNVSSPLMHPHRRSSASMSSPRSPRDSFHFNESQQPTSQPLSPTLEAKAPPTPPPSSVAELETRTFATLSKRHVVPTVDPSIQLVQCAGRKDTLRSDIGSHASSTAIKHRLQLGLIKCLTAMPRPRFFSLTLTDTEPASLLLEKRLLINFEPPNGGEDGQDLVLLGNKEDVLVPITLDLGGLPMESTGIVCGIAGRLVGSTARRGADSKDADGVATAAKPTYFDAVMTSAIEMSYLSTARAGTVVIAQSELAAALEALQGDEGTGVGGLPVERLDLDS